VLHTASYNEEKNEPHEGTFAVEEIMEQEFIESDDILLIDDLAEWMSNTFEDDLGGPESELPVG